MYNQLFIQAKAMIDHMEKNFRNLYSPEGYYNIYKAGYFPVLSFGIVEMSLDSQLIGKLEYLKVKCWYQILRSLWE